MNIIEYNFEKKARMVNNIGNKENLLCKIK
jgi:hypothetical protein